MNGVNNGPLSCTQNTALWQSAARRSLTLKAHAKGSFVVDTTSGVICQLPRITKESCLNKEGTTTGANFVGNVTYSRMF